MSRFYECPEHKTKAWSSEYDSFFCPVCFKWTEDYCKCTLKDKEAGECDYPLVRPETAEGQIDNL